MSTNFDQLALAGLVRSGVLPVVCDGIESLTRIRGAPRHPQLIELHGSRHTYRLRNSPTEVAELAKDEQTIAAISSIFQDLRAFVIVGYGGREDGIMDLLIKAAERFPDKRLVWIAYGKDPARISEKAKKLLATSRNSLLLVDQDADSFFVRLLQSLEIGAPETIRNPLFLASSHASTMASHDIVNVAEADAITKEVGRYRDEIGAMEKALQRHRSARNLADNALVQAQELRLAGNLSDALQRLLDVPDNMRDEKIWVAIGDIGLEHGKSSANLQSLEAAANAWRKLIDRDRDAA
jgi:tetratricopeptide (TPR) repeat protein